MCIMCCLVFAQCVYKTEICASLPICSCYDVSLLFLWQWDNNEIVAENCYSYSQGTPEPTPTSGMGLLGTTGYFLMPLTFGMRKQPWRA